MVAMTVRRMESILQAATSQLGLLQQGAEVIRREAQDNGTEDHPEVKRALAIVHTSQKVLASAVTALLDHFPQQAGMLEVHLPEGLIDPDEV